MKHKIFFLVFLAVLLCCVVLTLHLYFKDGGSFAEIYADGELLYRIDLENVESSYEIPIEHGGHTNIVLVENKKISIKSANCPDKLCVKQGAIHNSSYPIVCLPNKIVIQIDGGSANYDTPDAISK